MALPFIRSLRFCTGEIVARGGCSVRRWITKIMFVFAVGLALSNPLATQQTNLDTAPAELAFGWLGNEHVPNGILYAPMIWHTRSEDT
jgi:hypothetical protein